MTNLKIRSAMAVKGLKQWEVASLLGIHEVTFCRKLRTELPEDEQNRIVRLIEQSKNEGIWHNAQMDPPKDENIVLAIKQLKSGERKFCFARCFRDSTRINEMTWEPEAVWDCIGSNNILCWMPLPDMPWSNSKKEDLDDLSGLEELDDLPGFESLDDLNNLDIY